MKKEQALWLNPSPLHMKLLLEELPKNLCAFNLNMYYDDTIYFLSLVQSDQIIQAVQEIDSSMISNVWSLLDILKNSSDKTIRKILDYPGFSEDYENLRVECKDYRGFYSDLSNAKVLSWRKKFGRITGTEYPRDFLKYKKRFLDELEPEGDMNDA